MKHVLVAAFAALFFVTATPVVAQDEGGYFGVNVTQLSYEEAGLDLGHLSAILRGGYRFHPNFAVEGRFAIPLGDDTVTGSDARGNSISVDVEVSQILGVYLRANASTGGAFKPYFLLGHSDVDVKASASGSSVETSSTDIGWGIGADYQTNSSSSIGVEYMNYFDGVDSVGDHAKTTGFSLNWVKTF